MFKALLTNRDTKEAYYGGSSPPRQRRAGMAMGVLRTCNLLSDMHRNHILMRMKTQGKRQKNRHALSWENTVIQNET